MAIDTPHFAWPFERGATGKVNLVQQDSAEHIQGQEYAVVVTPLGYRPSRPDFGWPWPEFASTPLDLGGLREALTRLVPDSDVEITQWADLIDQSIRKVRVAQIVNPENAEEEI